MSSPSIVAVISGRRDSHDAVRWAAWLSQHGGLPLTVVHAYHDTATGPARMRMRMQHELRERARAEEWLQNALDESPALPYDLRLVFAEGSPDERARRVAPVAVGVPA
jgi:nucleotide-binding universal stress UspA family protein